MPGDTNKSAGLSTYSSPIRTAMKYLGELLPKHTQWPEDGIPPGAAAVLLSRGPNQPTQKGNQNPGFSINGVLAATESGNLLRGIDTASGGETSVPEWNFFAGGFVYGFLKLADALDNIQKENTDLQKKVENLDNKVAKQSEAIVKQTETIAKQTQTIAKQELTIQELKAMITAQNARIARLESKIETQNTTVEALCQRIGTLKSSTEKDLHDVWDVLYPKPAPARDSSGD